ncbi:MAG: HlyD family efflux transporter periplasmic adaptor subunit [Proteobacteria bacterium]|nr:MAG: HlyD family efflux transporter periplasmic adaptor subunit [Pseudomonadota bacterium]
MTASPAAPAQRLAIALQCQARALSGSSARETATAVATELATCLGLRAVHVMWQADGQRRRRASSHLAIADPVPAADPLLDAAFDEALDQHAPVEFPPPAEALQVTRAHAALARQNGGGLYTTPIAAGDTLIGAMLVETDASDRLDTDTRSLIDQVAALTGPILLLRAERDAPLLRRLASLARPAGPPARPWYRNPVTLAVLLAAGVLVAIPLPASMTAEARIEGEIQRALTAPADGYIQQAFVRPGDTVQAGQVLIELADREVKLERRRQESELAQHDNAFAAALSAADRAQMVVQRARADETRARIALIDHQLDRGLIRAPIDSIVLTGDLDQAQGTPVQRGEVLLVLAPQARYRLMIEVDERDIHLLDSEATGRVALSALPTATIGFTVLRILPVAAQRDGRHFIEVEARLDSPPASVKPGMRGYARVSIAPAPLAAQWTRRIRGWLRLQRWAWFGL